MNRNCLQTPRVSRSVLPCLALLLTTTLGCGPVADYRGPDRVCEVHKQRLRDDIVPIIYGLPERTPKYAQACKEQFPHANTKAWGGCVIDAAARARPTQRAQVRYCPTCREAQRKWLAHHEPQDRGVVRDECALPLD